jgi:hypothetical protein
MKTNMRVLLFFVLPIIAPLLYPPALLLGALPAVAVAVVVLGLIGFLVWRGRSLALTFSIFLQGFNVIIRMMMFFSQSVARTSTGGALVDWPYLILALVSIGTSLWLLLRLDRMDVRAQMVS